MSRTLSSGNLHTKEDNSLNEDFDFNQTRVDKPGKRLSFKQRREQAEKEQKV